MRLSFPSAATSPTLNTVRALAAETAPTGAESGAAGAAVGAAPGLALLTDPAHVRSHAYETLYRWTRAAAA